MLRYFKYFAASINGTIFKIKIINPITIKRIEARKEPSITIKTIPRISVINEIINFSKERGYKYVILCTYDKYDIATKFYQKRGFKICDIHESERWYKKEL